MPLTPDIAEHPSQPLRDKVVLITGGAQGIGRGVAQAVLGAGGSVMIGDLDVEAGKACLREWDAGARAAFGRLDVSREASVRRWVDTARKRFGRIDGLVNNAGIADPNQGKLDELSLATWNRYLGTNLTGAFLCSKHALPTLGKHRGVHRQHCLYPRPSIGAGYRSLCRQQGRIGRADPCHGNQRRPRCQGQRDPAGLDRHRRVAQAFRTSCAQAQPARSCPASRRSCGHAAGHWRACRASAV